MTDNIVTDTGEPLFSHTAMELPDKPGQRPGFLGWLKLLFTIIPSIPVVVRNRPSVVDKRVSSVSLLSHSISCAEPMIH